MKSLPYALLVAAVVLAYSNSFSGVFLFDDYTSVVHNPRIEHLSSAVSGTSRPLVMASFWLNYAVDGYRAAGYHLFNLAVHAAAMLALFGVMRRTLRRVRWAGGPTGQIGADGESAIEPETADALAWTVALLWGLHPLQTESVTYVCQRAESLMSLLYLLTLYCAIRGLEAARVEPRPPSEDTCLGGRRSTAAVVPVPDTRGWRWTLGAVACGALGMAAKEVMITAPLAVMAYDWLFGSRPVKDLIRRRWPLYAGLAATWGILAGLMLVRQHATRFESFAWQPTPWPVFLFTQCGVVIHYLKLAIWPDRLCLDYAWPTAQSVRAVLPQMLLLAGAGCAVVWAFGRRRAIAFAGVWFFLILAPSSSVIPRPDNAFEHRMYLPLAGVVAGVVIGVWALLRGRARPLALAALVAAMACALGMTTYRRNLDYQSEIRMWADVVDKRPQNLRARNDLAVALSEAGRVQEALDQYREVLARIPAPMRTRMEKGEGRVMGDFRTDSLEYHFFRAHANMGLLMFKGVGDADKAVAHYVLALRVAPGNADVSGKLAELLRARGVSPDRIDAEIERLVK